MKKEYRDVEYEPNKLLSAIADDFSDFQFAQPTIISNNAPIEPNPSTLSTGSLSNSVNLSNSNSSSNSIDSTIISNSILQPSAVGSILSDLTADKTEPLEVTSNDVFGNKLPISASYLNSFESSTFNSLPSIDQMANKMRSNPSALTNGNRSDFEFYSLNDNFTSQSNIPVNGGGGVDGNGILNHDITNNFGCATDSMEIFSISSIDQKHSTTNATSLKSAPIDNSANFQPTNHINTAINSMNSHKFTNSLGILTPQTATSSVHPPQLTAMNNNASSIQWPEPGINSDQLEQFEKRFFSSPPQSVESTKANVKNEQSADPSGDDEWSDFVSVVQPQTPITNILNKNLLKQQQKSNDEDDWSEFMSSTPSNLQRLAPNSLAMESNSNYESMFKSWNRPANSQHTNSGNFIAQPNALRQHQQQHQQQKPICTIESNAFQIAHQPIAPSIISLPDLGFVAPKSLVNMPNISKAKK